MSTLVAHPLATAAAATVVAFALSAWILRWEFRHQLRQWRHQGFVIGGPR